MCGVEQSGRAPCQRGELVQSAVTARGLSYDGRWPSEDFLGRGWLGFSSSEPLLLTSRTSACIVRCCLFCSVGAWVPGNLISAKVRRQVARCR